MSFYDKKEVVFGQKYLDPDKNIGPGPSGLPKSIPPGYKILPDSMITQQIINISRSILGDPWGTILQFKIDNVDYLVRKEPHYHQKDSTRPDGTKWLAYDWHVGSTCYIKSDVKLQAPQSMQTSQANPPPESVSKQETPQKNPGSKINFLDRLDRLLSIISK